MRTNIVIDDTLMENVLQLGIYKHKREAVEAGLLLLLRLAQQEKGKALKGKLKWSCDLSELRTDKAKVNKKRSFKK